MTSHSEFDRRVRPTLRPLVGGALAALALTACAAQDATVAKSTELAALQLEAETLAAWREHIVAPATELAWEQIPWRPSFLTGLREAAAAGKPLLLWVMNGHPLGCT